jgi:hypothetical protein
MPFQYSGGDVLNLEADPFMEISGSFPGWRPKDELGSSEAGYGTATAPFLSYIHGTCMANETLPNHKAQLQDAPEYSEQEVGIPARR